MRAVINLLSTEDGLILLQHALEELIGEVALDLVEVHLNAQLLPQVILVHQRVVEADTLDEGDLLLNVDEDGRQLFHILRLD